MSIFLSNDERVQKYATLYYIKKVITEIVYSDYSIIKVTGICNTLNDQISSFDMFSCPYIRIALSVLN